MISGNEEYWMKVVAEDKTILEQMKSMVEVNPDLFDKRDIDLVDRFIKFMEMIFKYENLVPGEHKEIKKRLIRIHMNIPTKELEYFGYDFIVFNGLYVVADVVFIDASICKQFFSNAGKPDIVSKLDMPDGILRPSIKYILDSSGQEHGVAILKSDPIYRYINDDYPSKWSYPIF